MKLLRTLGIREHKHSIVEMAIDREPHVPYGPIV
jgi:hypothetical protein